MTAIAFRSQRVTLRDGRVVRLRAIRESDADEIYQAFGRLSPASRHSRFMHAKKALSAEEVAHGVNPRPGHSFAIVATIPADDGIDIVGAAQFQPLADGAQDDRSADAPGAGDPVCGAVRPRSCEFAITVAEDWRSSGLARRLLTSLVNRARRDGYESIEGFVLADNAKMLALARRMKFSVRSAPGGGDVLVVRRELQRTPHAMSPRAAS